MTRFRPHRRVLDGLIVAIAGCLCAAPFVSISPFATAASSTAVLAVPMTVDQQVQDTALVSKPLQGTFDVSNSGKSTGQLSWDVYTSDDQGFKLSVASNHSPAMVDSASHATINDYATTPSSWSVGSGQRVFGFSAEGQSAMSTYSQGSDWRGFNGSVPIEVARKLQGPSTDTVTTLDLAAEMKSPLPSNANPIAFVVGTASINL